MTSSRAHQRAQKISGRPRLQSCRHRLPHKRLQPLRPVFRKSKMKKLKNTKRCGERSEAAFLHKASELGFSIAKPWGDSERYDFILDNGSRLLRVQIKATDCLRAHAYETRATYTVGKGRAVYGPKDIDFLVAPSSRSTSGTCCPSAPACPRPCSAFIPIAKQKSCASKNT